MSKLVGESSLYVSRAVVSTGNWVIQNRGGFSYLAGFAMVPSQFMGTGELQINKLIENQPTLYERFTIAVDEETTVRGLICFPQGWNRADTSRCVIYHNPNGCIISSYFNDLTGEFQWTPAQISQLRHCPIILYDYRGCGLSQAENYTGSMGFKPTYQTIQQDGITVTLKFAKEYHVMEVWGSSLGGGVATISLDYILTHHPELNTQHFSLYNHDSFSTTPRVVWPKWPKTANCCEYLLGGYLDAETPMKRLIKAGIQITILCHTKDPVIPRGARMAECLPQVHNVNYMISPLIGHANLSSDLIQMLN
jgi:hypothetical protein